MMYKVLFHRDNETQLGKSFSNELSAQLYKAVAQQYLDDNSYNNITITIEIIWLCFNVTLIPLPTLARDFLLFYYGELLYPQTHPTHAPKTRKALLWLDYRLIYRGCKFIDFRKILRYYYITKIKFVKCFVNLCKY